MYHETVRKPASIQRKKKEQVSQKVSDSVPNSLSLQMIASQARSAERNPQSSGAAEQASNLTGLPESLKAGVEALSGFSLDSVRVHYNSPEPKKLNARAYTRGTDIYVGTGQERSLPHEAWHVVQQLQDRVRPTQKINSFNINDSVQLEREADIMGARALSASGSGSGEVSPAAELSSGTVQCDWKSTTLEFESQEALRGRILGFGLNRLIDDGLDPDEYDDAYIYNQLNPAERDLLRYSEGLRDLQNDGLAHTIHHMLSRNKLNAFYQTLSNAQKAEIKRRFSHSHHGLYVEQNDERDSAKNVLFSLRSNLVLGPNGQNRTDDPAHMHGAQADDFDPTAGDYAPVSDIYAQINDKLIHGDPNQTIDERNNEIIRLLIAAEGLYARIQAGKNLRPDLLNTDVRNLWVTEDGGRHWRKRTADDPPPA